MRWTDFWSYAGLRRPFDFTRAVPFLLGCFGLLAVGMLTLALFLKGTLNAYTTRSFFLIYLFILFTLSILLLNLKYFSMAFLSIGIVEIFLVFATYTVNRLGFPITILMPANVEFLTKSHGRFKYHPLLMAIPRENFVSKGALDIRHNSKNMRGREIILHSGQHLVNVYGGSSTYDLAVPNGATWPENLENNLGKDWVVANLGVPGYSTAEHVIQTAFYSDQTGALPACAVYYIGWNDIRNAHIPALDNAYADFHLLSQLANLQVRGGAMVFSPLWHLIAAYLNPAFDTVPYPPDYTKLEKIAGSDPRLESIFRKNIRTIQVLNANRGIKTVFIGQILNPAKLTADSSYGWLPRVKDKDVWPLQKSFNTLLKNEAAQMRTAFIMPDVTQFEDSDFVDNGHFSVKGSAKFAKLIAPEVMRYCQ